jgi:hypothetical protein
MDISGQNSDIPYIPYISGHFRTFSYISGHFWTFPDKIEISSFFILEKKRNIQPGYSLSNYSKWGDFTAILLEYLFNAFVKHQQFHFSNTTTFSNHISTHVITL